MNPQRRLAVFFTALTCALFFPAFVLAETPAVATTTEAQVRAYFWDLPVMSAIARCESEFTQFNVSGTVLHGGYKRSMIGIYQIAPMHIPEATSLGFDVNTIAGNMGYARYLYNQNATSPWLDSKWCWSKLPDATAVVSDDTKFAMIQKQIDSIKDALALIQ